MRRPGTLAYIHASCLMPHASSPDV